MQIFRLIDEYPDFSTFFMILLASVPNFYWKQHQDSNSYDITYVSHTFSNTTTNVLMKRILKVRRPKRYYEVIKGKTTFEGSFPSFHSQFSAGEATTFVLGIVYYSPKKVLFTATLVAILIASILSILTAVSRIVVGMHYIPDVVGGSLLGVITGFFVVRYISSFWKTIGIPYHLVIIAIFVFIIYTLSEKHRKIRL